MRVVVPFTDVTLGCRSSLERYCPQAELYDVSGDVEAYWRLLSDVWADGETFVLIEHDAEWDERAIRALEECPEPYCKADGWFRFCRFRSSVMRDNPNVFSGMPRSQRHWLVLENFARKRLPGGHSHIAELGVANGSGTRWFDSDVVRWRLWRDWCLLTLPPEEWPPAVAEYVREQHGPCSLPHCKRRGKAAFPASCERCEHEPFRGAVVIDPNNPRLDASGRTRWGSG